MTYINIKKLMKYTEIELKNKSGKIIIKENMSSLENNFKNDWLYLGIYTLKQYVDKHPIINSAAFIGEGNGIGAISLLNYTNIKSIFITDIVANILPTIKKNIEENITKRKKQKIIYLAGRDCLPLTEKVDLIYGNLPLIMVNEKELKTNRSTTTLTNRLAYEELAKYPTDNLRRWSMLSQLGFLISAEEKLREKGSIITLIGGRIPYNIIEETFQRANLSAEQITTGFQLQSDSEFLKNYARFEKENNITFDFYEFKKASNILEQTFGFEMPDLINAKDNELKKLLRKVKVSAQEAYQLSKKNISVGHIAYSFEAKK